MRAIVQHGYGDPSRVLRLEDVDAPTPGEGEVLVRVHASSVNAGDWRRVYGSPMFIRLIGGFRRPKERDLGTDVAGTVEAVGPGGSTLQAGDSVFGLRGGAYAEYVCGKEFVRKPANLTLEAAAAVPLAGVTALQALQKHGSVEPGEHVAVLGAGGGVGTFAVQIAKALGAHVTAVTSTDKLDLVRSIGADVVVDYMRADFTRSPDRYELMIEIGGATSVRSMRRALAPGGRIVLVGAGRGRLRILARIIGARIRKRLGQPVTFFVAYGPYEEQLTTLRDLIEAGKVSTVIDRTYSLANAAEAIRYAATEKVRGKVIIRVAS